MKRVLIILGVLVVLLIVAIVTIPFFIDFEKHKSLTVQKINTSIPGKLVAGNLEVSLWGGFGFQIANVQFFQNKESTKPLISVSKLNGRVSLFSLISGAPNLKLNLIQPQFHIIRDKDKKINMLKAVGVSTGASGSGGSASLGLLLRAKLSLDIQKGSLLFEDHLNEKTHKIEGFDLSISNLGLDSSMQYALSTRINYEPYINGKIQLSGGAKINLRKDFSLKDISLDNSSVVLSGSRIVFGKFINKEKGIPLRLDFSGVYKNKGLNIKDLLLKFHDLELKASGVLSPEKLNFSFLTNKVSLEGWSLVSPLVQKNSMKGECSLNGFVKGSLKDPNYGADFNIINGEFAVAQIRPGLRKITTEFHLEKDLLQLKKFSFEMGKSSLSIKGSVKNFKNPEGSLTITSPLIDLRELKIGQIKEPVGILPLFLGVAYANKEKKNLQQEFLEKLKATGSLKIDRVVTEKLSLDNLSANLNYKNGSAKLQNLSFNSVGGTFKSKANIKNLFKNRAYDFSGKVKNLDTNRFLSSLSKDMKDTLFGKLQSSFNLGSRGVSGKTVSKNLSGSGDMLILNGAFSTLKIGEAIRENLKGNPLFSGSPIFTQEFGENFQKAEAHFNIQNERVHLKNLDVISESYQLASGGWAYFNQKLDIKGFIRFPANLVANGDLLSDEKGQIRVPFTITGTFAKPKFGVDVITPLLEKMLQKQTKGVLKPIEDIFKGLPF